MSFLLGSRRSRTYVLLLADSLIHILAFLAAGVIRHKPSEFFSLVERNQVYITVILLVELLGIALSLWDPDHQEDLFSGFLPNLTRLLRRSILIFGFIMLYLFATKQTSIVSRMILPVFFLIDFAADLLLRYVLALLCFSVLGRGTGASQVLMITESALAENVLTDFAGNVPLKHICGLILLDRDAVGEQIAGVTVTGSREDVLKVQRDQVCDEVLIHVSRDSAFPLDRVIMEYEQMGITVDLSVEAFGLPLQDKQIGRLGDLHVVTFRNRSIQFWPLMIKRLMDIIGGLIGSLLTLLLTLILGPIIKLQSKGPIFFVQTRVGKGGRKFQIYKFRSMVVDAEQQKAQLMEQNEMQGPMFHMEEDPRVIPIGRFMRRTFLDEFPQFFNVLKGDMSLVGTRPPTVDEVEQYENYHLRRLSIKPGITGMWQVRGRGRVTDFESVVKMDFEYIDSWSLGLDLKILFQTVGLWFRKK